MPRPGSRATGAELITAAVEFPSLGLPLRVAPRHTCVSGDTALLIADRVVDGRRPDGEHVHLEGTATDVARRGPDGLWRHVVDHHPYGTARHSGT